MKSIWWKDPVKKFCTNVESFLFEYETPRVVTMRSRRIGLTYRITQLALFIYLVGYVFMYSKSYQRFDSPSSSVVTKVKGTFTRNLTASPNETYMPIEIWDNNDLIVPAQESDAFFVATNLIWTASQIQGICPEDINVGKGAACRNDTDCPVGTHTPYGNGIRTGRCVQHTGTCEISSWCPTENDTTPMRPLLSGYDSMTVLVKNHIVFRKFGVKRRNILDSFSEEYLQTCRYHPIQDPLCPVFALRDMVAFAGEDLDVMAVRGGVIGFHIDWDCNLDNGLEECLPVYSFQRLDNRDDKVAKGWNFRHSFYHYDRDGQSRRDLIKFWGIRFVFLVNGRAGEFYAVNLILHVGSSIGLFGLASLMCEFLLSCGHKSALLEYSKTVDLEKLKATRRSSRSVQAFEHVYGAGQVPRTVRPYRGGHNVDIASVIAAAAHAAAAEQAAAEKAVTVIDESTSANDASQSKPKRKQKYGRPG